MNASKQFPVPRHSVAHSPPSVSRPPHPTHRQLQRHA